MSIDDLNRLAPNAKLQRSNTKLNFYDGSYMKPLGVFRFYASHNEKTWKLQFEIVTTRVARRPLLSANTCERMGLITIHNDQQTDTKPLQPTKEKTDQKAVNFNRQEEKIEKLLTEYSDVFEGLGRLPGKLHLEVDKTVEPIQHTPRKVPIATKEELRQKILAMQKAKILKKVDTPTDWISSMVVVKKPGKLRICICPKDLNKALRRNHYPLPTIEEILPGLAKAKVFSVLDAKDGFHQVELDEESSYLTTFWTPFGRYRWLRMPFGINVAPEEYMKRQKEALEGLEGIEVIADDILVCGFGDTMQEAQDSHDKHLKQLFERCRKVNLKLNRKKFALEINILQ